MVPSAGSFGRRSTTRSWWRSCRGWSSATESFAGQARSHRYNPGFKGGGELVGAGLTRDGLRSSPWHF
ncbi:hypothetical protein DN387_10945 [Pseudomonas sp. FBF18]|nr:hypothetical protein [Pseudomonas sp. FBF18]MCQ0169348.1 hypothetical protein [Pseudomonas sp. S12(2018)]